MSIFRNRFLAALFAIAVAAVGFMTAGCASNGVEGVFNNNQRPTVNLTQAPLRADSTRYFYAYRINWSGYDPDGRIDHYEYTVDPPSALQVAAGQETVWVRTTKNEEIVFFRATRPDSIINLARPLSADFHIFVIKAIDNTGTQSEPKVRAFYSYTVAPEILITNPRPNRLLSAQVTPSVRITWTGKDPDGQFSQKPVKYKYLLIGETDPNFQLYLSNPDSLRRFYDKLNFAGWDSTSAETTTVRYTNLTPGAQYMFVVIGFDEAGAYSPIFSLSSNILLFGVGFASTNGPRFFIGNEFFNYLYPSGGYTTDDLAIVKIEVASGRRFGIGWGAEPPPGSLIEYYRWAVDIDDLTDETPRNPEATDLKHWSQKSQQTFFAVLGPFEPGSVHTLYVEAADNNGLKSLAVVRMEVVQPLLFDPVQGRELLIVDDTRLESDKFGANGCPNQYTRDWPSSAELDTFLYARGGMPWRCTRTPTTGVITTPGVFAGYDFDTLGTRRGFEVTSNAVKLSKLAQYRHIVWLNYDNTIANTDPTSTTAPISATRFMCTPGRLNTLSAYIALGGKVWLLGGTFSLQSLISYDRAINNATSGQAFSNIVGEVVAGRMMYDFAHWRSEMATSTAVTNVLKSPNAVGGWSHTGFGGAPISAPNYALLPSQLRQRSAALGDVAPPTRTVSQQSRFYSFNNYDVEYMSDANFIIEDVDPDPNTVREISVLDTLMMLEGGNLRNPIDANGNRTFQSVTMTYYHGLESPPVVFSGFNIWSFNRNDCIQLVDFVLQQIWGLPRQGVVRNAAVASPTRSTTQPAVLTPAQRAINARLPVGRTRE